MYKAIQSASQLITRKQMKIIHDYSEIYNEIFRFYRERIKIIVTVYGKFYKHLSA